MGPVKTPLGFYVFEVEKIDARATPSRWQEVQAQIRTQLAQQAQQQAFSQFVDDYGSKWQSRTFCADDFVIDRCANFTGSGHPADGAAGLLRGRAREGGRPEACPAPVLQPVAGPARDGQRRHPAGQPAAAAAATRPACSRPPGPACPARRRARRCPAAGALALRRWPTRSAAPRRSPASTRSPGACGASAPGTASRTSARSSRTRSRRPTSWPTPRRRGDDAKLARRARRRPLPGPLPLAAARGARRGRHGDGRRSLPREADPPPPARLRAAARWSRPVRTYSAASSAPARARGIRYGLARAPASGGGGSTFDRGRSPAELGPDQGGGRGAGRGGPVRRRAREPAGAALCAQAAAPRRQPGAGDRDWRPTRSRPRSSARSDRRAGGSRGSRATTAALARSADPGRRSRRALGEALFALVDAARQLRCDPELALRAAAARFRERQEAAS